MQRTVSFIELSSLFNKISTKIINCRIKSNHSYTVSIHFKSVCDESILFLNRIITCVYCVVCHRDMGKLIDLCSKVKPTFMFASAMKGLLS